MNIDMVWFDYAILAVISISTLISLVRGFVREALSLVVWAGAFFVASQFYLDFATFLTNIEDGDLVIVTKIYESETHNDKRITKVGVKPVIKRLKRGYFSGCNFS